MVGTSLTGDAFRLLNVFISFVGDTFWFDSKIFFIWLTIPADGDESEMIAIFLGDWFVDDLYDEDERDEYEIIACDVDVCSDLGDDEVDNTDDEDDDGDVDDDDRRALRKFVNLFSLRLLSHWLFLTIFVLK